MSADEKRIARLEAASALLVQLYGLAARHVPPEVLQSSAYLEEQQAIIDRLREHLPEGVEATDMTAVLQSFSGIMAGVPEEEERLKQTMW